MSPIDGRGTYVNKLQFWRRGNNNFPGFLPYHFQSNWAFDQKYIAKIRWFKLKAHSVRCQGKNIGGSSSAMKMNPSFQSQNNQASQFLLILSS
jgi:hypothetical protein